MRPLRAFASFVSAALGALAPLAPPASAGTQIVGGPSAELVASDAAGMRSFGRAIAADGNLLAVADANRAAVYVFERVGGSWTQTALVSGPGGVGFGVAVDVEGDTLVVGGAGVLQPVALWVYERTAGTWAQAYTTSLSGSVGFGHGTVAVAVSGDRCAVGAMLGGTDRGQARVYSRAGGTWAEEQAITAFDAQDEDYFGCAVALDGTTLLVGAYGDDGVAYLDGSVYAYEHGGGGWTLQQKIVHPAASATGGTFGFAVALDGERALIGAPYDDPHGTRTGSAQVFERAAGTWSAVHELVAPGGAHLDQFGTSVALAGDVALAGAPFDDGERGSAVLFAWNGAAWEVGLQLASPHAAAADRFGESVALGSARALVGAWGDDGVAQDSGVAFAFPFTAVPSFCDASDGALAGCPCANPGAPDTGCDNAQGTGGVRADFTSIDPVGQVATLTATGFPPASHPTAIVIRSTSLEPAPVAFADGLACVGLAGVVRLAASTASGGVSTHVLSHGAGPGTFHYQVWYRNVPASFCTATAANTSSGRTVVW